MGTPSLFQGRLDDLPSPYYAFSTVYKLQGQHLDWLREDYTTEAPIPTGTALTGLATTSLVPAASTPRCLLLRGQARSVNSAYKGTVSDLTQLTNVPAGTFVSCGGGSPALNGHGWIAATIVHRAGSNYVGRPAVLIPN